MGLEDVTVDNSLLIALPKGRMADDALALLGRAGLPLPSEETGRKLILEAGPPLLTDEAGLRLRYILAKPTDVATYVEYGAADVGICGLDSLRESGRDVYEPLLLPFGHCRLSVAGPANRQDTALRYESQPRVATKYPRLARDFFRARGLNAEIIPLNGSVELGPLVGLADLIVDLVETGATLRENGLVEFRTILQSQAVLVVNRAAFQLKAGMVQAVVGALREVVGEEELMVNGQR